MKAPFIFILIVFSLTSFAQDQKEQMRLWKEYASPGKPHEILARVAGTWSYKSNEDSGRSHFKLLLKGRFLQQELTGKAMGQDFTGHGIIGFDNMRKKYDILWMDSMSTGVIHGSGTYDEKTKTLREAGEYNDPTSPTRIRTYKAEWKFLDKNNMTYTMWTLGSDGKESKRMELVYKRID